jgi:hypothetical protein
VLHGRRENSVASDAALELGCLCNSAISDSEFKCTLGVRVERRNRTPARYSPDAGTAGLGTVTVRMSSSILGVPAFL